MSVQDILFAASGGVVESSLNFTLGTGNTKGTTYLGIAYGDGQFVVVGNTQDVAYSTDGVSWTVPTDPALKMPVAGNYRLIAYGNGTFVAIDTKISTSKIAYTTKNADGTLKWNLTTEISNTISSIKFIDGLFIATKGTGILYSSDGITWTFLSSTLKYPSTYGQILGAALDISVFNNVYRLNLGYTWTITVNGTYQNMGAYAAQEVIRINNTLSMGSSLNLSSMSNTQIKTGATRAFAINSSKLYASNNNRTFSEVTAPSPNVAIQGYINASIVANEVYVFFPTGNNYALLNRVIYIEPNSNQQKVMTLSTSGKWIYCAHDGNGKVVALSTDGKTAIFNIIK